MQPAISSLFSIRCHARFKACNPTPYSTLFKNFFKANHNAVSTAIRGQTAVYGLNLIPIKNVDIFFCYPTSNILPLTRNLTPLCRNVKRTKLNFSVLNVV